MRVGDLGGISLPRSQLQNPFDAIASAHQVQLSQPHLCSGLKASGPITGI